MTLNPATRLLRGSVFRRVRAVTWSIVLFVVGWLIDYMSMANVPGASVAHASQSSGRTPTGFGVILGLIAIAAWVTVFWRRRLPLLALVAGAVFLLIGTSYVLFLIGVLNAMLTWRSRERMLGAIAIVGVGFFAFRECTTSWGGTLAWLFGNDPTLGARHPLTWNLVTVSLAVVSLALTFGVYAYRSTRGEADSNRRLAARERRRADALSVEVARQAEREELARNIHDTVASSLSRLSLQAGALEVTADSARPDELKARARDMHDQSHAAFEQLRTLLKSLRSDSADDALASATSLRALSKLLHDYRSSGVAITPYVMVEDAERAASDLQASVYRIAQESLTNATKHATGAPVSVHIEVSAARGARLRVSNPLVASRLGAPSAQQGLNGIRERAQALGGTAWIGAHNGEFIVDVSLPWREHE